MVAAEAAVAAQHAVARHHERDRVAPHGRANCTRCRGLAEVAGKPYPDPTQFDSASKYHDETSNPDDPRWWLVDVRYVRTLAEPITLERIRTQQAKLGDDFALTRKGNRLSVLPVSAKQWKILLGLEGES